MVKYCSFSLFCLFLGKKSMNKKRNIIILYLKQFMNVVYRNNAKLLDIGIVNKGVITAQPKERLKCHHFLSFKKIYIHEIIKKKKKIQNRLPLFK